MVSVQNMLNCFLTLSCLDTLDAMESAVNILGTIAGGICAVSGIRYISILRKKRLSATFSFWIQLRVRIEELRKALSNDNSIVNGLYSHEVRIAWNNRGSLATDVDVERFYNNAQETLQFIKNVSDQIPANKEWLSAYMNFIDFLIDISQYDIRNYSADFKFTNSETLEDRQKYCNDICKIMETILKEIKCKQNEVASKL